MSATVPLQGVTGAAMGSRWRLPGLWLALIVVVLGAVFHQPLAAMAVQWSNNETYAHGWLILPISLWLIWRQRDALARFVPRPDPLALIPLAGLALVWLVGEAAGAQVLEQYAVVAMVPAFLWLLAGRDLLRAWGFPLAFLLLAVPFGGFLVQPLMEITADMTVALVRASGIPVYREGLFFTLPTGHWSVVEACSGIRYLIASVTLGLLYAYLAYYTLWRRALFVVLAIALPILANGLRAYGIVMLGHLSGMTLAVGVDHLIYGWVFFGLVMLLMFWIGRFWQERQGPPDSSPVPVGDDSGSKPARSLAILGLGGLVLVLLAPAWAAYTEQSPGTQGARLGLPERLSPGYGRLDTAPAADWRPHYLNLAAEALARYDAANGSDPTVYVGLYRDQREGAELVAWENSLTPPAEGDADPRWRSLGRAGVTPITGPQGQSIRVPTWRLTDGTEQLLVWRWYWVAGDFLSSDLSVKLRSAWGRLSGGNDAGAVLVVAVPAAPEQGPDALAPVALLEALSADMARRLPEASHD